MRILVRPGGGITITFLLERLKVVDALERAEDGLVHDRAQKALLRTLAAAVYAQCSACGRIQINEPFDGTLVHLASQDANIALFYAALVSLQSEELL